MHEKVIENSIPNEIGPSRATIDTITLAQKIAHIAACGDDKVAGARRKGAADTDE